MNEKSKIQKLKRINGTAKILVLAAAVVALIFLGKTENRKWLLTVETVLVAVFVVTYILSLVVDVLEARQNEKNKKRVRLLFVRDTANTAFWIFFVLSYFFGYYQQDTLFVILLICAVVLLIVSFFARYELRAGLSKDTVDPESIDYRFIEAQTDNEINGDAQEEQQ
ncbi:MAG: hypothetical protein ACI4W6_05440 [Acutalibacteraceae bacterium]